MKTINGFGTQVKQEPLLIIPESSVAVKIQERQGKEVDMRR
jgi:hypothetical protein